jgi:hypothetical protein
MDDFEDPDMEARMGELMGFATFGTKPEAKRQKIKPDGSKAATSSNMTPLGQPGQHARPLTHNKSHHVPQSDDVRGAADAVSPTTEQAKNAFPTGVPMEIFDRLTWKELEAYRRGVRQENGDLAYFLPSFIEDPWAKLEAMAEKGRDGGEGKTSGS